MRPLDPVLAVGAALRLTRLVTTDTLPEWLVIRHLRDAADRADDRAQLGTFERARREQAGEPVSVLAKIVEGLDCPWCVGLWIAGGVVASYAATARSPRGREAWRAGTAALSLGYVVGAIEGKAMSDG